MYFKSACGIYTCCTVFIESACGICTYRLYTNWPMAKYHIDKYYNAITHGSH